MIEILGFDFLRLSVGFIATFSLFYWFLTKNYNYWSKLGISGPKPILLFGNFLERVRNPISSLDTDYAKKFGKIYGIFNGTDPVLHISEPALIKQVLVKEFNRFSNRRELRTEHPIVNKNLFNSRGDDWKRLRTITSSTFTSGKMKKMYHLVRRCLQEYLNNLDDMAQKGEIINARKMNQSFTLDVIASCAFATQTNSQNDPKNKFVVNFRKIFVMNPFKWIPAFVFPKSLNKFLGIQTNFDSEANDYIINFTRHVIEKRRNEKKNNDFIQLLIDAKADENNTKDLNDKLESHHINEGEEEIAVEKKVLKVNFEDKTLTEDEIIAQCWVFLLAGFETTATTLGYLTYELTLNPECQEKAYKEVMSAVGSDGEIDYDELQRLPYLDAMVSETLRLYPPVTRLERECNQKFKLSDTDITLYDGQMVEIPVYAIHHSEEYYKNAEHFIPERFLPENRHQLVPYTYLPFGTGPRNCIGMRFGLMEVKLAMAHIIMKFRFNKCSKTAVPLKFDALSPLLSTDNIFVGIEKR